MLISHAKTVFISFCDFNTNNYRGFACLCESKTFLKISDVSQCYNFFDGTAVNTWFKATSS